MERNVSLIARLFTLIALAASAWVAVASLAAQGDDNRLVLVANASSPLSPLSASDVRRLYLGIPLMHAGREINALLKGIPPVRTPYEDSGVQGAQDSAGGARGRSACGHLHAARRRGPPPRHQDSRRAMSAFRRVTHSFAGRMVMAALDMHVVLALSL